LTEQLTLNDIALSNEHAIELYLRSGYTQTETAQKGYDASLVAQVAANLPADLDIDRIPY
jgi:hypothetical protein